ERRHATPGTGRVPPSDRRLRHRTGSEAAEVAAEVPAAEVAAVASTEEVPEEPAAGVTARVRPRVRARPLDRLAAGLGAGVAGLGTGLLGARSALASGEVLRGVAERAAEHHVGDGRADDHAADRAEHAGTDHRTEAGAGPGPASEAAL